MKEWSTAEELACMKRWATFQALPESHRKRARRNLEAIDALQALIDDGAPATAAVVWATKEFGVAKGSLYRWRRLVARLDRADWLPALAPRYKGGGKPAAMTPEAWAAFKADYLRPRWPRLTDCYRRIEKAALAEGWEIPGEQALRRRLERELPKRARERVEALAAVLAAEHCSRGAGR